MKNINYILNFILEYFNDILCNHSLTLLRIRVFVTRHDATLLFFILLIPLIYFLLFTYDHMIQYSPDLLLRIDKPIPYIEIQSIERKDFCLIIIKKNTWTTFVIRYFVTYGLKFTYYIWSISLIFMLLDILANMLSTFLLKCPNAAFSKKIFKFIHDNNGDGSWTWGWDTTENYFDYEGLSSLATIALLLGSLGLLVIFIFDSVSI